MSNVVSAYRSITKSALAALLGISENDLLTRDEAATEIGVKVGSLANFAVRDTDGKTNGPAFYRSTTSPTGGTAWYPRAEVLAFASHRAARIKSSYREPCGQQNWTTLQDGAERLPVHTVVAMVRDWKASELYHRAQAILHDPNPLSDRKRFEEECRLFGVGIKGCRLAALGKIASDEGAAAQRKAIFDSFEDQSEVTARHLLALCGSSGISITRRHPSFDALTGMLEAAWRDVLEAEMRWRNYDFTGMPDRKPHPMCNILISDSLKTC